MERRKAEERQNILKRKVIQKLYQPTEEENHFLKNGNNYASNALSVCNSSEHQDSTEPVAKAFKVDMDTSYDLKPTREENSNSECLNSSSEVDHMSSHRDHKRIVYKTWNGDRLSPYLSDDEDSEEKSANNRKRKRRHHHLSASPRLGKRSSSSSSSSSSQVHHAHTATPHPHGLSSRPTQNHRRKLKRKRRQRDHPKEESQGVVYTFKSNI